MAKKVDHEEMKLQAEAAMTLRDSLNFLLKQKGWHPPFQCGPAWLPSPKETDELLKLIRTRRYCSYLSTIKRILNSD